MMTKKLYTAVGRFTRQNSGLHGRSYPMILLGGKEYPVDLQEMSLWTTLNWRIARWEDIGTQYEKIIAATGLDTKRSWEDCAKRLLTRGLLVSGCGNTEYDALYDLLGALSIIPASGSVWLRCLSFFKLTCFAHVPFASACQLFRKDQRTDYEKRVMALAGQMLLSTAEIIQCVDHDLYRIRNDRTLLDSLYADDITTSDNIVSSAKSSRNCGPVTLAVANLYLRQQIIFERV